MTRKKVYLGLDVHASTCTLGCMDGRGNFQRTWTFSTSENELIRHVQAIDAGKKSLALEEGPLAYWVSQTLTDYATEILIADAREIPLLSHSAKKRDTEDTHILCRLLRMGELKRVYHPADDKRAIFKAAVQHYIDLRTQQIRLKHKIKAKYRGWGMMEVEGKEIYNFEKRERHLRKVRSVAVRNQLERLYHLMNETLHAQDAALDEADRLGRCYPEIRQFRKIPGVGKKLSLIFDAYIQTPHRFTKKSQLYRYCKLAVTDRSSGGKPLGYRRLDKAGNGELKAMSYRVWLCALNKKTDNEVSKYYQRSLNHSNNNRHARLNTQRKIVSVMHGIWRKKEEYKPDHFLGS